MQKVEGSSPFSRLSQKPRNGGVSRNDDLLAGRARDNAVIGESCGAVGACEARGPLGHLAVEVVSQRRDETVPKGVDEPRGSHVDSSGARDSQRSRYEHRPQGTDADLGSIGLDSDPVCLRLGEVVEELLAGLIAARGGHSRRWQHAQLRMNEGRDLGDGLLSRESEELNHHRDAAQAASESLVVFLSVRHDRSILRGQ